MNLKKPEETVEHRECLVVDTEFESLEVALIVYLWGETGRKESSAPCFVIDMAPLGSL